ncbi:MAG: 4-hydroxythreonine-4-phosphate dehydrogenase PdxA [Planctomycetota bacterium]|nr:4-hydroxythreonine-4-phosphate dehydrogenase PdxA [Planctomycetota bacterium]
MTMQLPKIAVTMGDPAGVGPEVCLRLLSHAPTQQQCMPLVFGDAGVLESVAECCRLGTLPRVVDHVTWEATWDKITEPTIIDFAEDRSIAVTPGVVNEMTGRASYRYIKAAIDAAMTGKVDAVTTGPIHKKALNSAGIHYPGHTEIFAAETHSNRVCMMLTCDEITCSFVTTHVGYRDVPAILTIDRILEVIEISHAAMSQLRGRQPKLVVCALNPHAGEDGLFGDREEERIIAPAIELARRRGIHVEGPVPPDTAFLPDRRRETDCFVCMYHDQGHIPLKALAFDVAVNVTLGLPIIRTSVDHGTALDIAWQGKAEATSMIEAVKLATQLVRSQHRCASAEAG